jgi:hypothetical protein
MKIVGCRPFQFVALITTLMKLLCSNCVVTNDAFYCCRDSPHQKCFGRAIWAVLRDWQNCLFLLRHGSVGQGRSLHSPNWFIIYISIMKVSNLLSLLNYLTGRHSQSATYTFLVSSQQGRSLSPETRPHFAQRQPCAVFCYYGFYLSHIFCEMFVILKCNVQVSMTKGIISYSCTIPVCWLGIGIMCANDEVVK